MITRWAQLVTHYPKWVILTLLVLLLSFSAKILDIQFDTSTRGYLKADHPSITEYDEFRDIFGRDEFIVVAIEHDNVFSFEFLQTLQVLHENLYQALDHIKDVDSLINARHIYGEEDELIVEDLLEIWPEDEAQLLNLKNLVVNNPLYQRLLISDDHTMTNIILRFQLEVIDEISGEWRYLEEKDYKKVIPVIHQVIAQNPINGAKFQVAGTPIMVADLETSMLSDMQIFTGLTILLIALFLWFLFRSLLALFIPILTVLLSLLVTIAAMAWLGQPLQIPSVILPSFILAVGIGAAVHLITIYFKNLEASSDKVAGLTAAIEHTFTPMFLTSITTAAGLFSFSQTDLVPIANLGMFSSIGVMVAFLLTVTFLPACLIAFSSSSSNKNYTVKLPWINWIIQSCMTLSFLHPLKIIFVVLLILIVGIISAMQLHFSHDPMKWIPDNWPVQNATQTIDKKMGGTVAIELILDTQQPQGIYDRKFMMALDAITQEIKQIKTDVLEPGKVLSVVDMLKETEQALHANDPAAYRIPASTELIAQQLFLLEMSGADDLKRLVDDDYQKARISISAPSVDSKYYEQLMDETQAIVRKHLPDVKITATGIIPIFGTTLKEVIRATAQSYVLAFIVITIMMILLLKSFGFGLLAMLPNLSPIIIVMGLLYWVGAPLDMFTMLIGSIAIGLSVDDTVHFMYHYRDYRSQGFCNEEAIEKTLNNSGRAMLITSIVLACGFFIFTASSMNNLFYFGLFTGLTILLALLADFLLAPALLMKLHKYLEK